MAPWAAILIASQPAEFESLPLMFAKYLFVLGKNNPTATMGSE